MIARHPLRENTDDQALSASQPACGVALLAPDGAIFWCDAVAADLLGGVPCGFGWPDLLAAIRAAQHMGGAETVLPRDLSAVGEVFAARVMLPGLNGAVREVDLALRPVRDEQTAQLRQCVLTLTTLAEGEERSDGSDDSTDRQEVERSLNRNTEEWEKTFDALSDVVTIQDRDMTIIRANRAAHAVFGLNPGELIGKKCYEVFQQSGEPCMQCPILSTCHDSCIHSGLIYNRRLDKTFDVRSAPILDEKGGWQWLVHIARDVTHNLRQEEERRLLSMAIEQASESVVITDADGCLQYVNPAFCRTTGYSRQEVVGQKAGILKSGMHDAAFYNGMWDTLLAGKVWRGRLTNRKKNGELFTEDATISPVVDSTERITNFIALKRDITREDLLERQLRQAIKMEAIGTLAGGIAHDFNNILSAIIGYAHMARGKLPGDSQAQEDLEQIEAGGDRAVDLVKQILTFARQETEERFRPLRLQYIVKEVLKLLRSSFPATIGFSHFIDNGCGPIMADAGQMHQLLMNLCTNARQAIGEEHGEITIRLERYQEENRQLVAEGLDPLQTPCVHLLVRDTGCGMAPRLLERIFDPFFTTRAQERGTGLGLSVVHGIVMKHKGVILVDSTEGKGSSFDLYFPMVEDEPAAHRRTSGSECFGSERILLVDDEVMVGTMHERMLRRLGYLVSYFSSSIEAVKAFRENPDCCDLVVTDMTMPQMTGTELAREMLALRPGVPIILMTGYSEAVDKEKAARIGIREFLLKPVDKTDFSIKIKEALSGGAHSDS